MPLARRLTTTPAFTLPALPAGINLDAHRGKTGFRLKDPGDAVYWRAWTQEIPYGSIWRDHGPDTTGTGALHRPL